MMQIVKVHSANLGRSGKSLYHTGGVWTTKPFTNWKKARDRMRDHAKSYNIQASEAALATQGGSVDIVQQLQKVEMQERMRNRAAVKSLIRCTHFLARHILLIRPISVSWLTRLYLVVVKI